VLGYRCVAKMTNIEGKRYGENGEQWWPIYNQFVAESEINEANLVLKWSRLLSELQHAPRNFERAEGDEYCAQKCR